MRYIRVGFWGVLVVLLGVLVAGCEPYDVPSKGGGDVSAGGGGNGGGNGSGNGGGNGGASGGVRLHINTTTYEYPMAGTRTMRPVSEVCNRLGFCMFRLNGEKVFATKNQTADDANFGVLDVTLEAGVYVLVCVGHNGQGNATLTSPTEVKFPNNKMTDTFAACDTITLEDGVRQSVLVALKRRVAMVRMVLDEEVPSDVQQLKLYYTGGSSTLNVATGYGCVNSRQTEYREVPASAYTQTGSTYDIYTLPHTQTDQLKITVTAYDIHGMAVAERVLTGVVVRINEVTQLHTTLFDGR